MVAVTFVVVAWFLVATGVVVTVGAATVFVVDPPRGVEGHACRVALQSQLLSLVSLASLSE